MRGCSTYSLSLLGAAFLGYLFFGYQGIIVVVMIYLLFGLFTRKMNPVNMVNERDSRGEFIDSFLRLSSVIMKADGKVMRSELTVVQDFIRRNFGENAVRDASLRLRDLLKEEISIAQATSSLRLRMPLASRIQLLHYLTGIANADGAITSNELAMLRQIAMALAIPTETAQSVFAMYGIGVSGQNNAEDAYKVLGIESSASDEDVKKAYRKLAIQNHPDKVAHLGADVQAEANKKFQAISAAYERIKKERGIV